MFDRRLCLQILQCAMGFGKNRVFKFSYSNRESILNFLMA